MGSVPNQIYNYLSNALAKLPGMANSSEADNHPTFSYSPNVDDVLDVKAGLIEKFELPLELVDTIIDFAEYWPHTTSKTISSTTVHAGNGENRFLLRSYPIGFVPSASDSEPGQMTPYFCKGYPHLIPQPWPSHRDVASSATEKVLKLWALKSKPRASKQICRKVVFTFKSRDQGWGGERNRGDNVYSSSYTWFDVGLEKVSAIDNETLESSRKIPLPTFGIIGDLSLRPIVCSLRTIYPMTIVDTESVTFNHSDDDSDDNSGSDDVGREEAEAETAKSSHPSQPAAPAEEKKYKFDHPLIPTDMVLQKNQTANPAVQEYTITWSADDNINPESAESNQLNEQGRGRATGSGKVVRSLEAGDVLTVWAKARFAG